MTLALVHSCQTWEPDLGSPAQLAQAEQNWRGLGADERELAAWARMYGAALLDAASVAAAANEDKAYDEGYDAGEAAAANEDKAYDEGYDAGEAAAREEIERLRDNLDEAKFAVVALTLAEGCMDAVAYALEDSIRYPGYADLVILAKRLRDRT